MAALLEERFPPEGSVLTEMMKTSNYGKAAEFLQNCNRTLLRQVVGQNRAVTLLAPSNKAWNELRSKYPDQDRQLLKAMVAVDPMDLPNQSNPNEALQTTRMRSTAQTGAPRHLQCTHTGPYHHAKIYDDGNGRVEACYQINQVIPLASNSPGENMASARKSAIVLLVSKK